MSLTKIESLLSQIPTEKFDPTCRQNLLGYVNSLSKNDTYSRASVEELLEIAAHGPEEKKAAYVRELTNRFHEKLSFGTSGLRGRTIAEIITSAEGPSPHAKGRPQHPCAGTRAMNFHNVSLATQGLLNYLKKWAKERNLKGDDGQPRKPRLIVSHDTRHFSRDFAEQVAKIAREVGVDVILFESARSTPELSFALRQKGADLGIMITASHNPYHDNGYKVYGNDGASILSDVADAIIAEVSKITSADHVPLAEADQGSLTILGEEMDDLYVKRVKELLLNRDVLKTAAGMKIVYTALHGCGGVLVPRILQELGFAVETVKEQDILATESPENANGMFRTVKSPNPENADALAMGIALAKKIGAPIVIGTDPDCDRMAVAVQAENGEFQFITGNQIGSLMALYRIERLVNSEIINDSNRHRAVLIKTFVTTDLQKVICHAFGITCAETLTGFKYIGQKLAANERSLPLHDPAEYLSLSHEEIRQRHLASGRYFIFGGEESFGYAAGDFVRDKDGNAAVLMFAELAAHLQNEGETILSYLRQTWRKYGYFFEETYNGELPGKEGKDQIKAIMDSYRANPLKQLGKYQVRAIRDFKFTRYGDNEGGTVPNEDMMIFDLSGDARFAVRPSGTEPKIKFYFFLRRLPEPEKELSNAELTAAAGAIKFEHQALLQEIWADVKSRTGVDFKQIEANRANKS